MNSAIERLLSLRVKDIAQGDVVTVQESQDLRAAAKILADAEVSGAPVVNAQGHCVGVLSGTNFLIRESHEGPPVIMVRRTPDAPYQLESLNDDLVAAHMSPEVISVSPEASIVQAARKMCHFHVHRLIVLDEERRPVGVVSTLDIVAALVAAIDE